MVTDYMSWKELSDEIVNDFKESHIDERFKAIRKIHERVFEKAINAKKDKIFKPIPFKTKRNNTFYTVPMCLYEDKLLKYAMSRNYLAPIYYKNHLWIAAIADDNGTICVFLSHHLFCRYEERFNQKEEITEKTLKTAAMFIARNASTHGMTMNDKKGKDYMFSLVDDGVVLGDLEDDVMVFRTYIRYDMLHEDQRKIYEQLKDDFEKMEHSHMAKKS